MILLLLAFAFLVISTFFVYKTAKENGYNAILWAAAAICSFVGVYLFLAVTIVIIITIGIAKLGWSRNMLDNGSMMIDFFVTAASAASVILILRHVSKIKDDEPFTENLPPPPTFDNNN